MKQYALIYILFCLHFSSFAQDQKTIAACEEQAVQLWKTYRAVAFGNDASQKANDFYEYMIELLNHPQAVHHPFDSLKKIIRIVSSLDNKVRLFSWNREFGGTWHNYVSFLQYKQGNTASVRALHTEKEMELGGYTDAVYYQCHRFESNGRTFYLLLGSGTHGAGQHHKIARLFQVKKDRLEEMKNAFDGAEHLLIIAARRNPIQLEFDSRYRSLIFDEHLYDDENGFAKATGKVLTLKWKGSSFKP